MAKKVLTALLALSMALSAFALPAAAETEHSPEMYSSGIASVGQIRQNSKFVYKINRNKFVEIIDLFDKAIGTNGVVKIPATIDGMRVRSLEPGDFFRENCKKIKVVDIPDSVDYIEKYSIGFDVNSTDTTDITGRHYYGFDRYLGVKIKCSPGSSAESYAAKNGVKYVFRNNEDVLKGVRYKEKYTVSTTAIRFRWYEVEGADGYEVYRWTMGGEYKKIKTLVGQSNTVFKDSKLDRDQYYKYYVKAYRKKSGKTEYSVMGGEIEYQTKPKAPTVVKVKTDYAGTVSIKVKTAKQYSPYRSMIYDDLRGNWCSALSDSLKSSSSKNIWVYTGYYVVNPFTKTIVKEYLESGKTYKVRFCYDGFASIYSKKMYYPGDYCSTLSIKAK